MVDTTVLQKANAPIETIPRAGRAFVKRVALLRSILLGQVAIMVSPKLVAEYRRKIPEPRNDYVHVFLDLADSPGTWANWKRRWSGADRERARGCHYPREDDHVLRTAIRDGGKSTILTEETRMLASGGCIRGAFGVAIADPTRGDTMRTLGYSGP